MGAIAGWIGGRDAPDPAAIVPALEALEHRGACGEGVYAWDDGAGRRLVLGQPYYDAESRIAVALDGSPANLGELRAKLAPRGYRFASGSAAEALARAYEHWDKDVVRQLRGAFAFAIWDARKERLMLARDRLGEKPLYLCEQGPLFFASQIKALLRMPGIRAQPDALALRDYLAYRYVPGPRTLVRGIRKLAPGSYALWQFGRLREQRYWVPPDKHPAQGALPVREPVSEFTAQLEDAVKLRLPAAVLLSGGFDSATLVALASRHAKLKTYSAGFADDPASELAAARRIAERFGTEHHEIVLAPRDIVARLPEVVAQRDAPVSRPADVALYFIASEAVCGTRAVLSGDGADEILGGYRRHLAERHDWLVRSVPTLLMLAAPLVHARPRWQGAYASLRTPDWPRRYVYWTAGFASDSETAPLCDADAKASRLRRALYFDQASWLPDHVLERAERLTAAVSLEARLPFLDHRLVEFVSSLPDGVRLRGLSTKWILRQAAKALLPGLRPRRGGFAIPAGAWLRGELADFLNDQLRGSGSLTRAFYEPRALEQLLQEHACGRRNHENLLWTLLNLEIWHRACLRA